MAKILFIDGPWRGYVRDEVAARMLQFVDYSKVTPAVAGSSDAVFPVGTYWVHKYVIGGRVLLLGSTSYGPPDKLADDVFWDLLASDKAREVAQVVERASAAGAEGGRR